MDIIKTQAYINGAWVDSASKETFEVVNPYDKKVISNISNCSVVEVDLAIEAATKAFDQWKNQPAKVKSKLLHKWYKLILSNLEELAQLISLEQGKSIKEAKGEVLYGASYVKWFAEEALRIYGETIPATKSNQRMMVLKQPIGVVAAITPWNFPNAMITRKVAPAIAAGCSVILKPAEDTPLSALALAHLADLAGFPPGLFNVIPTKNPEEIGLKLCTSKKVRKISFTGSTAVGKILMKQSANTLKKLSFELGGNAPFIVFEDADVNAAVDGAMIAKYRNSGQTCICANRFFIHEKIYDQFVEQFKSRVEELKVGSGMEGSDVGPLINEAALSKVHDLTMDAVDKGATITLGGKSHANGGTFYEPTIISDVTVDMNFSQEEIFGPIAPIYRFGTDDEVIDLANSTDSGLAAYFYSREIGRVWKVAEALEFGMVGVNTGFISAASAPFGGVKESGFGREGSKHGLEEYLNIKYICMEL